MRLFRRLLGITTKFNAEQAQDLACRAARERGVVFTQPFQVASRLKGYLIISNADVLGGNVTVVVDCRTGQVGEFHGPMPR